MPERRMKVPRFWPRHSHLCSSWAEVEILWPLSAMKSSVCSHCCLSSA
jgi:hypothetical protein